MLTTQGLAAKSAYEWSDTANFCDMGSVLAVGEARYCPACGNCIAPYIDAVHGPVAHPGVATPPTSAHAEQILNESSKPDPAWLTLSEAATKLHCSYTWLSRKWRDLGLRPSKAARQLLFSDQELEDFLGAHRIRRRGRPRMA
jgi:hypothetical protein